MQVSCFLRRTEKDAHFSLFPAGNAPFLISAVMTKCPEVQGFKGWFWEVLVFLNLKV